MTIPRLELSAAAFSVKLDKTLRKEFDLELEDTVFGTDSAITINYINNEDRLFHTFVVNRLSDVHEGSTPAHWQHVSSALNAEDDLSRGLTAEYLLTSQIRICGQSVFAIEAKT